MNDATPKLYSSFKSSASWRVRTALAYKDIQYQYQAINLDKLEQKSPEYAAMNPLGQLPCLMIDGVCLTQSVAILEYLEETKPEKRLLPKEPAARAQVRRIVEIINSWMQPLTHRTVLRHLPAESHVKYGNEHNMAGLRDLERVVRLSAGSYCVGDEVTFADIYLVPQITNAVTRYNVEMSEFPLLVKIKDLCEKQDYFKAADPINQPDCPDEFKQFMAKFK